MTRHTPDRVVARYPGTPEPGTGHHAPAGAAGHAQDAPRRAFQEESA